LNPFSLPLQFEPHSLYGSAIDGEAMPFGYISTANRMPIFELSTPLKWPTDALASLARQMAAAPQMFAALLAAESFISGFEDDDLQEGLSPLLGSIRAIIRSSGAGSVVIAKAQALGKTESLLTIVQETQDTTIYAAPAEDWRPIDTSPKDGTPILARYMWAGEHRYLVIRRSDKGPWWLADHDGLIKHDDEKAKPSNYDFTHWRPIIPPTLDGSATSASGSGGVE
jgi:hypothetical protein